MRSILYCANNDGSDTRIFKEIKSLSSSYNIYFIGVTTYKKSNKFSFCKKYCSGFYLVKGNIRNPFTIFKYIYSLFRLLKVNKVQSVHIVNEQLLSIIYPIIFFYDCVLDQFDSFFLSRGNFITKNNIFQKIFYKNIKKIIVTDENRKDLLPIKEKEKIFIVPNYPLFSDNLHFIKKNKNNLSILYFGWLGKHRGSEIIDGLIQTKKEIEIISAGWIIDDYTKNLINKYPKIFNFKGTVEQKVAKDLAKNVDYIMCVYAPINDNNIHASPNKIYDSIQMQRPVIINSEIKISKFVEKKGIGFVIPKYDDIDYMELYNNLISKKTSYKFDNSLRKKYCWEKVEQELIEAHTFK